MDPSSHSYKTQRGWGFFHHCQVLLLVYCQDFTMVLLVWPSLASPRRTDLTLGRGVTDAQLYPSIQPPSASLTAFSCIMDSSVSTKNPEQSCKYLLFFFFFPGDRFIECIQIFTLETRPVAKTCGGKKIDCPDLTQLSSEEVCGQHTPTCSVKWQDEDKREGRGWLYSVEHHT